MSRLAGVPRGAFLSLFSEENELDEGCFVIHEAMQFAATRSWWGKMGPRVRPHEGLDICRYVRSDGRPMTLCPGVRIPVTFDGDVQAMMADDFMGRSICVNHEINGFSFLSVYAHVEPVKGLQVGDRVEKGEVIATLSDPKRWGLAICAHLHLSLMQTDRKTPESLPENFRWERLWNTPGVSLYNPESLLGRPLTISEDAADAMLWQKDER